MSKIYPQLFAAVSAAMGGFNTGTVLGWTSSAIPLITKSRKNHHLNKGIASWIAGSVNVGAAVSLILAAFIMDRIGRKWLMLGTVPLFVIGWIVLALVNHDINYIAMRVVLGMAGGVFCIACPMYAAEIAETRIRGLLGTLYQVFLAHGILFSNLLGLTHNFLMLCLFNLIPVALFCLAMSFMPQSPSYLLKRGKKKEAKDALIWLRAGDDTNIDWEIKNLQAKVLGEKEQQQKVRCKDFFVKRESRRSFCVAVLLTCSQQFSGINAIIFYMGIIFISADADAEALPRAIYVCIVQAVATFICAWLVEVAGRRILMLASMMLMGTFLTSLTMFFYVMDKDDDEVDDISWVPVVALSGFMASYSLGAGPLPWSMLGEIFPEENKTLAACLTGILNWTLSLLTTTTFLNLNSVLTVRGTFLLYACMCFGSMVLLFFFLPETKGFEYQDIQGIMKGERPDIAPIGLRK